jgi:DNA repair protein RecO (recombination protein O)
MHIKTRAILLQAVKHQDNALLLKLFTHEKGLVTCYIKNRQSKSRRAVKWQVLDTVNVELLFSERNDIYGIRESSYAQPQTDRYFDPHKLSLSFFVAEVLLKVITEKNTSYHELFAFAEEQIEWLDKTESIAFFPIEFLTGLSDILGIRPRVEKDGFVFNFSEGSIEKQPRGLHSMSTPEVLVLGRFLETGNFKHAVTKEERTKMLQLLLDFYKYHVTGFAELKSLMVLKEVLN